MQQGDPYRQCIVHREVCIAIDINPDCDEEKRHCCAKCLLSKKQDQKIQTYKEAQLYLRQKKKQFKEQKDIQQAQNMEILKRLAQRISSIKDQYNQVFDNLSNTVKQQITFIEDNKEQLHLKLSQINIDSYLSGNNELAQQIDNLQGFIQTIQGTLDGVMQDNKIAELKKELLLLDIQKLTFIPENLNKEKKRTQIIDLSLNFLCPAHGQDIIMFDLSRTMAIETRMMCQRCLKFSKGQYSSLGEIYQQWEEYKLKQSQCLNQNYEIIHSKIERLIKVLQEFKEEINMRVNKIIAIVLQQEFKLKKKKDDIINKQAEAKWSELSFSQISEILEILLQPNYIQNIEYLQNKDYEAMHKCIELTISDFLKVKDNIEDYLKSTLNKLGFKLQSEPNTYKYQEAVPVNYQIIQLGELQIQESCNSMALSSDKKTLVVGHGEEIHLYNLNDGKLILKQIMKQHKQPLTCLTFMKNENQFVSVSGDQILIIWILQESQWQCEQFLQQIHYDRVSCVIVNADLIITSSFDTSIKFWKKKKSWFSSQTFQVHDGEVLNMNLSLSSNQLVSCGQTGSKLYDRNEGEIIISQKNQNNIWQVVQKISSKKRVNKVSFIGENMIVYQTKTDLIILGKNQMKQNFEFQRKLFNYDFNDDSFTFPLKFSMQNQLLLFKNSNKVSIIKFETNQEELQFEQMIIFQSDQIIGVFSDDGQLLITWDAKNKRLQVRKLLLK